MRVTRHLRNLSDFKIIKVNLRQSEMAEIHVVPGFLRAHGGVLQPVGIGSLVKKEEIKWPTPFKSCYVTP